LNKTGYLFTNESQVKVITGKDEALDAWITANYLEKNFNKKSQEATKGILDLGGASTQILFVPQANYNGQNSKKIKLFGTEYNTYTQSFLCFGLNEANLMYRAALLKVSFLF
jgi:Golgi nucleoside diphosphatase